MSRAEEITSEVRKLVLTCRSLEAQLQQSIPKKAHQEIVAKMQLDIDSLKNELAHTKSALESTTTLGERINSLEMKIGAQNETISTQGRTIDTLSEKLSQNTVPLSVHSQVVSKVQELENRVFSMVEKVDYDAMCTKCSELEEQVSAMVPRAHYEALEKEFANYVPRESYEELKSRVEQMVSRDRLSAAEERVSELEKALSESVPRQDFEELTTRIAQITSEGVEPPSGEPSVAFEQVQASKVEEPVPEIVQTPQPSTPVAQVATVAPEVVVIEDQHVVETVQEVVAPPEVREVSEPPSEQQPSNTVATDANVERENGREEEGQQQQLVPYQEQQKEEEEEVKEITEVQSQLSEINSTIETGESTLPPPNASPIVVDSEKAFRFHNTDYCARSGIEFLEDIEKLDISVIEEHSQNGDFERWFREILSDEVSAQSLQSIRQSNASGEELRHVVLAAIAPRYRS